MQRPSAPVSCHCSPPTLSNGARSKIVHLHGDGKVLEVVEELEEGSELIKGDSLKSQKKSICEGTHFKLALEKGEVNDGNYVLWRKKKKLENERNECFSTGCHPKGPLSDVTFQEAHHLSCLKNKDTKIKKATDHIS